MSRADVVVFTVGNKVGTRPGTTLQTAKVRVAAAVPATALPAAAADGPQSERLARPRSPLVEAHEGELVLDRRRHERRQDRQDQDAALPRPPGLKTTTPLLCGTGCSMTARLHRPREGWRSPAGPAAFRTGSPRPSGRVTRRYGAAPARRPRPAPARAGGPARRRPASTDARRRSPRCVPLANARSTLPNPLSLRSVRARLSPPRRAGAGSAAAPGATRRRRASRASLHESRTAPPGHRQ